MQEQLELQLDELHDLYRRRIFTKNEIRFAPAEALIVITDTSFCLSVAIFFTFIRFLSIRSAIHRFLA